MACPQHVSPALDHMARRVEADPLFLAHPLAAYRDAHGMSDDGLCDWLQCDYAGLVRAKLCRAPADAGQVAEVAAACGCDAGRLGAACGIPGD